MKKILNIYSELFFNCLVMLIIYGCYSPPGVYDENRDYYLPYPKNSKSFVVQGINGPVSHQGWYAIDFVMDEGTPVIASRSGVVSYVRENCPNVACTNNRDCCGNNVKISHEDGTFAIYYHLIQNGACVEAGDIVERGDVIGLSGNTGVSVMPHLHFEVGPPDRVIELAFADVYGDGIPIVGWNYTSSNDIGHNFCVDDL